MTQKLRVLVTGATGLVGESVIRRLLKNPDLEVLAMGGQKRPDQFDGGLRPSSFWSADIADRETIERCFENEKIDCLVHAAGLAHQFGPVSRDDFMRVNVLGTENVCLLAAALKARRFILISSVSVYGDHGQAHIDESFTCRPDGDYAESKYRSEIAAAEFCRRHGIVLTILRLATVVGEKDQGNVKRLITKVVEGKFRWIGKGDNKKSLVDKEDVASAIELVIKDENTSSDIFNLTQKPIEMRRIVEAITETAGVSVPNWFIPATWALGIGRINQLTIKSPKIESVSKTVKKWLSDDLFSNRKFYESYGFLPPTRIEAAIEREVKHFLNEEYRK